MTLQFHRRIRLCALSVSLCLGLSATDLRAQIRTDGSVGPAAQTLTGPVFQITENLGRVAGSNLFHSFETFSIANGQTARFSTTTAGIANVISRVTGGASSTIDGRLILSGTAQNLFFINPAGVTFGANARINVPGNFHVSTADYIKFPDGVFHADLNRTSSFSSAAPEAFGFLGTNAGIASFGDANLTGARMLAPGGVISVVAGWIEMDNSTLTLPGGHIRMAATGAQAVEIPVTGDLPGGLSGSIRIGSTQADPSTASFGNLDASADGAGTIEISGGSINLDRVNLWADNLGNSDAAAGRGVRIQAGNLTVAGESSITSDAMAGGRSGSIDIHVRDLLTVNTGARIATTVADNQSGSVGNVTVHAGEILLDGTDSTDNQGIFSRSNAGSSGNAGKVAVTVDRALQIIKGTQIASVTHGDGNGGTVTVNAGTITIDGQGEVKTGIFGHAAAGSGNAGEVRVQATGDLLIRSGGKISSDTLTSGNAAAIAVSARNILIDGQGDTNVSAGISSSADTGSGGSVDNVTVRADQSLTVRGGGRIFSAFQGATPAEAGSVDVSAGGAITVSTGGQIYASTWSNGDAGDVLVRAAVLTVDAGGISAVPTGIYSNSEATATGNARSVRVAVAGDVGVMGGGQISSSTFGAGQAGSVTVTAGNVLLDALGASGTAGGIFSNANPGSSGHGGSVNVAPRESLVLRNGGEISTATHGAGSAGLVAVTARDIEIDGADNSAFVTGIHASAEAGSGGQTGGMDIQASRSLRLANGATISIRNAATVADPSVLTPTTLTVAAPDITLIDSVITAAATGNVAASNIVINSGGKLYLDPSSITTSAVDGNGGAIFINANQLWLDNSQITTSVLGLTGNGGDIFINANTLVMNTGFIQANTAASGASGGNIAMYVTNLIPSGSILFVGGDTPYIFQPFVFGYNVIQAAAPDGVSGTIAISSPSLDLSGTLANINAKVLNSGGLGRNPCRTGGGSSLDTVGRGGMAASASGTLGALRSAIGGVDKTSGGPTGGAFELVALGVCGA